jgi:hypothetical protein
MSKCALIVMVAVVGLCTTAAARAPATRSPFNPPEDIDVIQFAPNYAAGIVYAAVRAQTRDTYDSLAAFDVRGDAVAWRKIVRFGDSQFVSGAAFINVSATALLPRLHGVFVATSRCIRFVDLTTTAPGVTTVAGDCSPLATNLLHAKQLTVFVPDNGEAPVLYFADSRHSVYRQATVHCTSLMNASTLMLNVSTAAGDGVRGTRNGRASVARFSWPMAVAVTADGSTLFTGGNPPPFPGEAGGAVRVVKSLAQRRIANRFVSALSTRGSHRNGIDTLALHPAYAAADRFVLYVAGNQLWMAAGNASATATATVLRPQADALLGQECTSVVPIPGQQLLISASSWTYRYANDTAVPPISAT